MRLIVWFIGPAYAEFADDCRRLAVHANAMADAVDGWNKRRGISGALKIQRAYRPFYSAIFQLENSAGTYGVDETDAAAVQEMASSISELLYSLADHARDFHALGAGKAASGNIEKLIGPSENILSDIYRNAMDDSEHLSYLAYPFWQLGQAFSSAGQAFGVGCPNIPSIDAS